MLLCSALISGAEVAFFSLSKKDIDAIREKKSMTGKLVLKLLDIPKYLLATILVANNLINVGIVVFVYFILNKAFNFSSYPILSFFIEVVLVTFSIVIFGEVMPKIYASQNKIFLSKFMAIPIFTLNKLFKPINYFLVSATSFLENKFQQKIHKNISADEIDNAIDLTVDADTSKEEVNILKGIVRFGDIDVTQAMKARVDIVAAASDMSFTELVKLIKTSGYSRILVYEKDLDHITGVLHAKDLLKYLKESEEFNWKALVRESFFVPEAKKLDDLLKDFQAKRIHIAIVVDEYGGTSGIITLEDVMEEVVGDIKDEFDELEEIEFKKLSANNYEFNAKTLINDMCRIIEIDQGVFDEVRGDSDSLGGLILELTKTMPKINTKVVFENFTFKVISVGKKRINKIGLSIKEIKAK